MKFSNKDELMKIEELYAIGPAISLLMEGYIESLNQISAKLDAADRANVDPNSSEFRSLKVDESYNINAAFLHGMFFENISDLQSQLQMDTLAFMRLERDFGSFDAWQKDFIAFVGFATIQEIYIYSSK